MAGNHVSQLSPRQRMINMMYLVLTALLALNVSKKVLDSFFKVDKSLTQTILEKRNDNYQRYFDFVKKAEKNSQKIGPWNDLAQELKIQSDNAINFIDSLRFELWRSAKPRSPENEKKFFNFKDEKYTGILEKKSLYEMHKTWGEVPEIEDKANATKSTKIMVDGIPKENVPKNGLLLKNNLSDYRDYLLKMDIFPLSDSTIHREIKDAFEFPYDEIDDKSWEYTKFNRIPVVAVLTFLNQLALDVVNAEDKMLTLLEQKTGTSIVSIDRQIPYGLPKKSYLNTGDKLEMSMLLMGIDTKTKPTYDIYELDYNLKNPTKGVQEGNPLPKGTKIDSIVSFNKDSTIRTVDYQFTMDPQYKRNTDPISPNFDGMGEYTEAMRKSGKQWIGGVITVISDIEEDGKLEYPWATEIVVEKAMSVISATNLKALYVGVANDFKLAVPGYSPNELTLKSDYKGAKISKKGKGEFRVTCSSGIGKTIKLWVTVKGKGKVGEAVSYKIYPLPPPDIAFNGGRESGEYRADLLRKFTKLKATTNPSFIYDLDYQINSCQVTWIKEDGTLGRDVLKRGNLKPIRNLLSTARSGQQFTFTKIKVNIYENKNYIRTDDVNNSLVITVK